jgi:hypothetical protein
MKNFNCEICRKKNLHKDRVCYKFDDLRLNPDGALILVTLLNSEGKPLKDEITRQQQFEERELTEEGFLGVLYDAERVLPEFSTYQIATMFYKRVCVEAFADPIAQRLIEAESEVSDYSIDINDPDVRTQALGFYMKLPDLIEAFGCIRGTKFAYEKWEYEEATKE